MEEALRTICQEELSKRSPLGTNSRSTISRVKCK